MIYDRFALTDRILIEEHTESPGATYARLTGFPDESAWHILSGTAHVEDGVLVLDDESPGKNVRRVDETEEAEAFLADLDGLEPWAETTTWRWASDPAA